jgi:hypothetical protein
MTFFVTSVGSGKGGDLGGLDGADAHCQRLAEAAGAGRTEKPNKHDMLTGSRPDGTAFAGAFFPDMTCGNWTKGGTDGSAMLGHHDRAGPLQSPWATSCNSAHPTVGCDKASLAKTGGAGLFYCLAAK